MDAALFGDLVVGGVDGGELFVRQLDEFVRQALRYQLVGVVSRTSLRHAALISSLLAMRLVPRMV